MATARGAKGRARRSAWLYLLVLTPTLTDLLEMGHFPVVPRGWLTEVLVGALMGLLIHFVRRGQRELLLMAVTDSLTGLPNRRAFDEAIANDCARAARSRQPLSLIYLDLDGFKAINDHEGHAAGDEVLRQFALILRGGLRSRVDTAYRIGGDEFAIILPDSEAVDSESVIERIRAKCANADSRWASGAIGVSAGIVERGPAESSLDLVRRADHAMYMLKADRQHAGQTDKRQVMRSAASEGA